MKIGMQTWGSHGDIRPFLALAEGLQEAGHELTLAITCVDSDRYDSLSSKAGVRIELISSPVIADTALLKHIGETILREKNPLRQMQLFTEKLFLPAESEMFAASERLCAENDLVIGHFFLYPLGAAAERYGRPYVSVALNHGAVPSIHAPPLGVPDLGTFGNRLVWRLARSVLNSRLKKYSDRLRINNGIPVARDLIDNVWASDQLTLLAISRTICARQRDWPDHYQICGFLDAPSSPVEGDIPDELREFLSGGAPPVYMTFGSMMSGSDEQGAIALLTDTAKTLSMRAIIQAPRWDEFGFKSDDAIHYVSAVPHAEVFPHCSLVVHHGGAGTTHAALRAGKPSVVVAHMSEQELWGRELERTGAGPGVLHRKGATPGKIAEAIRLVVGSRDIRENSIRLGAEMARENGVASAVKLIDDRFAA